MGLIEHIQDKEYKMENETNVGANVTTGNTGATGATETKRSFDEL